MVGTGRVKRAADALRPPVREQERTRFRAPTAVRFRELRSTGADRPARKPWVLRAPGNLRDVRGILPSGPVGHIGLPVTANASASRGPVPGVTASARLPLLYGRRGAVLLRSRCSPGAVPRRAVRSLTRVATAGVPGHRPGRLAARRLRGAGQIGRGVSRAVSLASLRRSLAAPCRPGLPASGRSRFGV